MQLTKGLRLAFLALLALHLVSAFAAIGLLGRMKPAIKRVIQQNVYSLEAVEAMLGELAKGELGEEEHFAAALERAQDNITNEREAPLVAQVRDRMGDVFVGDVQARALVVTDLRELAELNRADIVAANQEAERLGSAGAWAVAILAFLTLVAGLVALRRLDRRVLLPLEELHDVLLAVRRGEPRRRCQPMNVAASELARSMAMINRLIDDRSEALATASVAEHMALVGLEDDDRATLLHLLDRDAKALAVVDTRGELLACNAAARRALDEDQGSLRDQLRAAGRGGEVPPRIQVEEVGSGDRRLCVIEDAADHAA